MFCLSLAWRSVATGCAPTQLPSQEVGITSEAERRCATRFPSDTYFAVETFRRFDEVRKVGVDAERRSRYSSFLKAAREPSLLCDDDAAESYRLMRIDSSGVPIVVRTAA